MKLILEDKFGNSLDFSKTANQYIVSDIDGLYPPAGTISTSTYAGMDGSYLNNAFIERRNIVISFEMRGINIEKRRLELYKIVKPSRYIKLYYKTQDIDVYTEGYVETCNVTNFQTLPNGQISIICPDIYFYSCKSVTAYCGKIIDKFRFSFPDTYPGNDEPFPLGVYNDTNSVTIENNGDIVGFTIVIETDTKPSAPEISADSPTIYNDRTGQYFRLNGEIRKGDKITITTKTGQKSAVLVRNGVTENIINRVATGSTWLNLQTGVNLLRVDGGENLKINFVHTDAFLGV